ncbi:MAG: universal stress protein [Rhodobacteraceae bacterium]|nr:universal stress protein [Paracoccaceae bacterium]
MFEKIMVPVDLAHRKSLARALETAAALGKVFDAPVVYVGVTAETPTPSGHNPKEFQAHLDDFAAEESRSHGHKAEARAFPSHDPAIDLNDTLLKAADEIGADLIVMASHIPNVADHLWPSHGGQVAKRAKASVFVVR